MRFQAYFTVFATSMYMATASDTLGDTYSQVDIESAAETVADLYAVSDVAAMADAQPPENSKGNPAAAKKAEKTENELVKMTQGTLTKYA